MSKNIIIIGAGSWGGWTALYLQRMGFKVTLIDKAGPGNVHSGSGGKTRIIRRAYGASQTYYQMVEEAFSLWRYWSEEWSERLYYEKGALWMFRNVSSKYAKLSKEIMAKSGYQLDSMDVRELEELYPELALDDVTRAYWEPEAGYIEASRSCEVVRDRFVQLGGEYLQQEVDRIHVKKGRVESIILKSGDSLSADDYVLACGPWLSKLVPEVEKYIRITRQEVYYFDAPQKYFRLPIWLEFREGDQMFYGVPDHFGQGFKFAYDERTWELNVEKDGRGITEAILNKMRMVLANRFPGLAGSSVVKHHTCVYENSIDGDFIVDLVPRVKNALMMAGSSGHGFKMGPAIGKMVAEHLGQNGNIPKEFRLERLKKIKSRKSQYQA